MSVLEIEDMVLCSTHHHSPEPGQIIEFTSGMSGNDKCLTKLSPIIGYAFQVDPFHVTASHYDSGFHLFSCKSSDIFHIIILDSHQVHEYYHHEYPYNTLRAEKLNDIAHCDSPWSEFERNEVITTELEIINPQYDGYFDKKTIILSLEGKSNCSCSLDTFLAVTLTDNRVGFQ